MTFFKYYLDLGPSTLDILPSILDSWQNKNLHYLRCFAACPWKAKNDKCCVFPFTFKGKKYYKCIVDWVWMPWCATTSNFDKDGKWENYLPSTYCALFHKISNCNFQGVGSQSVFADCFNSESLSQENIILFDITVISRLCFISLYFNPFFILKNLKALIIIITNETLSNQH